MKTTIIIGNREFTSISDSHHDFKELKDSLIENINNINYIDVKLSCGKRLLINQKMVDKTIFIFEGEDNV